MTDESIDGICKLLKIETAMGKAALSISLANVQLLDSKQKDYGSGNISAFGEFGVIVRANDKLERLKNLHGKGVPNHESKSDSWRDLSNYGLIGELCANGEWK